MGKENNRIVPRLILPSVVVFALSFAATVADAQPNVTILGNYPPPNDADATANINDMRWQALSFSMPVGTSLRPSRLRVRLGDFTSLSHEPIFEIRNHTGSTNAPGPVVVERFFGILGAIGPGIRDYTFAPEGFAMLEGGNSYWLLVHGVIPSLVDWHGAIPPVVPTGIASYGGQSLFSSNGGASWTPSTTINSFELYFPIPEPSGAGLVVGALLVGLVGLARRRGGRRYPCS
jgi:hypothetical protein